jgi:MFS family permease
MTGTWRQLQSLPGSVQLLVVNQFGINLGFYMLMPYLANHLFSGLGMAAWTVGLVLGVRTLSQQGLFLLGGALADRLGYKPMIIAGCALRTVGFTLLGVVDTLPALLVASAATGLAGALFNPSVRAYVAREAGPRRIEAFAVFNVFYQAGILVGPLVGLALMALDFRVVCLSAAATFAMLTLLQLRSLPARGQDHDPDRRAGAAGVLGDWRTVVGNRAFLLFSLAMISSYVLSSQIYLVLPLQAAHVLGSRAGATGSSALFAVSAVIAILSQVRLTAWARARWSGGRSVTTGVALMAAAFLPLLFTAQVSPTPPEDFGSAVLAFTPTLVSTVLLTAGTVLAYPFEMDTIITLAGGRLVATHYGFYNTLSGVGITFGNLATGWIWGLSLGSGRPALVWVVLATVGVGGTVGLALLLHAGQILSGADPGERTTPAPTAASGATGRTTR